jgi:hypothetical protein
MAITAAPCAEHRTVAAIDPEGRHAAERLDEGSGFAHGRRVAIVHPACKCARAHGSPAVRALCEVEQLLDFGTSGLVWLAPRGT